MRSRIVLSLLILGVAGRAVAEAPLTIGWPGDAPFWVDVRMAFDPSGNPDPRYFGDEMSDWLPTSVAMATGDRVPIGTVFEDYVDARLCPDFDCAIRSAELIVRGKVVGKTFGFNGTVPGQLLEIRPEEVLKGAWRGASLFAFYPVASFCAGSKTIVKTDERWPDPPETGGEVFLYSGYPPWENGWVQTEYEGDIVPVGVDGNLRFGPRSGLKDIPSPRTAEALLSQTRTVLASREQKLQHATDPDGVPYLLYFSGNAFPEWVDARVALLPDGTVDRSLFRWELLDNATRSLGPTSPSNGTVRVGETDPRLGFFTDACSLDESARGSNFAALTRVTGRTFGFWWGIPGQLLRVESVRDYRGTGMAEPAYLFVPIGEFEIGGRRIIKTDSRFARPPSPGDEVFLFTYPALRSNIAHPLEGRGYVPVSSDGDLILGTDYRAAEEVSARPLRTKADLIGRMLEATRSAEASDSVAH